MQIYGAGNSSATCSPVTADTIPCFGGGGGRMHDGYSAISYW
jgi:hypothetical protein